MKDLREQKTIRRTLFFSLAFHCLVLGMPGFNTRQPHEDKKAEEMNVWIEIEKPPLLPKIDVMGEEKKLKEIAQEEKLPEPLLPKEEKVAEIAEKEEPQEIIDDSLLSKDAVSVQEVVEVINPRDEAMLRYQDMVKQKIEACRRYPIWARKQGFEGISCVKFTVLSSGATQDIKLIKSSGFDILDEEAVAIVKRASPFKPIPEKFNCSSLVMDVDIVFKLNGD